MLANDKQASLGMARTMFHLQANSSLPAFLFALSGVDQQAADTFYTEAIARYQNAPASELLFLSGYPFGLTSVLGPDSSANSFHPPAAFQPSRAAQRLFLDTLFRRVAGTLNTRSPQATVQSSDSQLGLWYAALSDLEALGALPAEYVSRIAELKQRVYASLSNEARQLLSASAPRREDNSFQGLVERAERQTDPRKRDEILANAILADQQREPLERLLAAADKVDDSSTARQLKDYIYFKRC